LVVVAVLDLAKLRPADRKLQIADIGTGSGILAICAAKHLTQATVVAVDVTQPALAVARRNAERHGVADRIEFRQSSLFESVDPDARFDYVLSNPPYVSMSEMAKLPKEVKDYEPHVALLAGERGTEVIEQLLPQAAARLNAGGALLMEVSPMIAAEVEQLLKSIPNLSHQQTIRDHSGHARVLHAWKEW
jgi:release factor glutamine methyltransferase